MKRVRCAIYTRKSSEEGLEQEFNSLHAQREACEAYIKSQKHEGWELLHALYDDGGFSGGTMERPALKTLMQDIEQGKVDVIVVYKVDRLTRSLADFAKLVELMDQKGISFVSVTQQFNTTTSMGRLTLNVLLSFAQFEREVTGERIRDKIALSKQKGKWMGGTVPLGYDVVEQKLVINEQEAKTIRHICTRYLALQSVNLLKAELDADGYLSKRRTLKNGKSTGGVPFFKGHLYHLMQNHVYLGEIVHKGMIYSGEHDAIMDRETFDKVQQLIAENRIKRRSAVGAKHPCLLAGKLFDDNGNAMTPKHSNTRKRHYRYYTSQAIIQSRPHEAGSLPNIPAHDIEQLVKTNIDGFLKNASKLQPYLSHVLLELQQQYLHLAASLAWNNAEAERIFIRSVMSRTELSDHDVKVTLCASQLLQSLQDIHQNKTIRHDAPIQTDTPIILSSRVKLARICGGNKIVLGGMASTCNPQLVKAITRSFLWHEKLINGEVSSITELRMKTQMRSERYLEKIMRLRFLSPVIIAAILDGTQPMDWTVEKLFTIHTFDWQEQHQLLGL